MPMKPGRPRVSPKAVDGFGRGSAGWMIALLTFAGCSPADGDRPLPSPEESLGESLAESLAEETRGVPGADTAGRENTPVAECVPPEGPLAAEASLAGRVGDYRLTMVERVDGTPTRTVEGSLVLLTQVAPFRLFEGSGGESIPGVTSPLFGSTDINLEAVGAVRVGDLSSLDPAAPGVLVIESETGTSPSILLRFGSEANRRDLVRFDGGYAVLTVIEIATGSFGGTWSSGVRGPDAEGFFCATENR